jgi:TPR repeat protein
LYSIYPYPMALLGEKHSEFDLIEPSPSKSTHHDAVVLAASAGGDASDDKNDSLIDNDQLGHQQPRRLDTRSKSLVDTIVGSDKIPKKLDKISRLFRSRKSLRLKNIEEQIENAPLHMFGDDKTPMYIRRLMKDAHSGDIEACFTLGYCFDVGSAGIKPNTNEAIFWYTKAADADHAIAQNNLGVIYSTGHKGLTKRDWAEALHWYLKAAEHSNPNACFHAGLAYMNGEGVEARDDEKAFMYYKRAAKNGHVLAMSNVGAMYMGGRGVDKNHKKAFKWLKKAVSASNDAVSLHNLGVMYIHGLGVLQDAETGEHYIKQSSTGKNAGIIPKELSLLTRKTGATLYNS